MAGNPHLKPTGIRGSGYMRRKRSFPKDLKYNPMNWGKPKNRDKYKCNCKLKK